MPAFPKMIWSAWLPVLGLCAAIFIQSCFPAPEVGPSFPFKDKMFHMLAYGMLAALFYRACRSTWPGSAKPALLFTISVLSATLYGLSDEVHQSFVAARQAEFADVIADFIGSGAGAAGYWLIRESKEGK